MERHSERKFTITFMKHNQADRVWLVPMGKRGNKYGRTESDEMTEDKIKEHIRVYSRDEELVGLVIALGENKPFDANLIRFALNTLTYVPDVTRKIEIKKLDAFKDPGASTSMLV